MPRTKIDAPAMERAPLNEAAIHEDNAAVNADAARRMEIATTYGDGQEYDRHRVVSEIKFYMDYGAKAMLEAGKRLVFMKESETHGDWLSLVEEMGLSARTAQKMMQAAVKFLLPNHGNERLLELPATKLWELAVLDDGEIKELAKGKTVAGLELDEIETLSTRELRDRLREAQKTVDAKDRVIAQKNKKLDEIAEGRSGKQPYEVQFEDALKEIGAAFDKLQLACAEVARVAESIPDLEFEGVEHQRDLLTLKAQLAVQFHGRSELALEQGVALFVAARTESIDGLLSMARKKLPEDIKAKLFGEPK